jgi:hypothetical protein
VKAATAISPSVTIFKIIHPLFIILLFKCHRTIVATSFAMPVSHIVFATIAY